MRGQKKKIDLEQKQGKKTSTITHPQQIVLPCRVKGALEESDGQTNKLRIQIIIEQCMLPLLNSHVIYRFPGGDILFDKREYFVTQVKGKAIQYVSQQDKWGCGRADTWMETWPKKSKKSSAARERLCSEDFRYLYNQNLLNVNKTVFPKLGRMKTTGLWWPSSWSEMWFVLGINKKGMHLYVPLWRTIIFKISQIKEIPKI